MYGIHSSLIEEIIDVIYSIFLSKLGFKNFIF